MKKLTEQEASRFNFYMRAIHKGGLSETLKLLGVNDKPMIIYLSAMKNPTFTVGELAEETKIPNKTVYRVIKDLRDAGLVEFKHGKGKSISWGLVGSQPNA